MKTTPLTTSALLAALLLGGCTAGGDGAGSPTTATTTSAAGGAGAAAPEGGQDGTGERSSGSDDTAGQTAPVPADDATIEYLACLTEHGLGAVIAPDGTVQYAVTEEDLGADGLTVGSDDSTDQAATEELCRKAVPAYTPPDRDER